MIPHLTVLCLVAVLTIHLMCPASVFGQSTVDELVFANDEAVEAFREARKYDSNYNHGHMNREQALRWYARAIELQPDAPVNVAIAERMGQILTFYADPSADTKPDLDQAAQWWQFIMDRSDADQLIGARARLGLSSVAVMRREYSVALDLVMSVAASLEPDAIEPPSWQHFPSEAGDRTRRRQERAVDKMRQEAQRLRGIAVERVDYLGARHNQQGAVGAVVALNRLQSFLHPEAAELRRQVQQLISQRQAGLLASTGIGELEGIDDLAPLPQSVQPSLAAATADSPSLSPDPKPRGEAGTASSTATRLTIWPMGATAALAVAVAVVAGSCIWIRTRRHG